MISHPRRFLTITLMVVLVALAAAPVFGQLSSQDIAALRAQGKTDGWTFTVGENDATRRPLSDLCGLVVPDNWQKDAVFDPCVAKGDLPERFDWRDSSGVTPIRNQGGCGGCWAFATVGPLECNIKIKDGVSVDLSEQYLISCNHNDWGCDGGWWAHAYHQTQKDPCNDVGAVPESQFPYVARDAACGCPYDHSYMIYSWSYVGTSYNVPSVDAMKQAIIDHGPIAVGVVATSAMQAYHGGIFNQSSGGAINHGVVLVGWDDNQGDSGIWIMRNSWGSWWGESGYMRIEYGCCRIGYGASYVNYPGALKIVTDSIPSCSLGVPMSFQLEWAGGGGTITWTDGGGNLAGTGLTLSSGGLLSGTPTTTDPISFTATVEDVQGRYDEKSFTTSVDRYLDGDANNDGEIDIGDGVYLVHYIFRGGPAPVPVEEAGDGNCDATIDISDAVYLINFVFKSGPPPGCN